MAAIATEQSGTRDRRVTLPWLGLALVLALQYGLFRQYAQREVIWCFPTGYDQSFYLGNSYTQYERILKDGPRRGICWGLARPNPQGVLFETEASLLYLVLGANRLSALTLNFLHLALFEVVLVGTLRWYSGRWGPAFLGLGLLLLAGAPFFAYGGMADFRLDFAAFCLYGVFLCAVLRSGMFASQRWSLVVGAAAAWLLLTRFITAVYLAGIFATVLALLVLVRHDSAWRRRIGGLLLAGFTLAALTGPVVLWKWPAIRGYYLGHFDTSENQIRGQEFHAGDVPGRLRFYLESLLFDHAGVKLLALAGVILAAAVAVALARRLVARGTARPAGPAEAPPLGLALALAALGVLVPLTVLTLFNSPSPCVGNVMAAALLLLLLLIVLPLFSTGALAQRLVTSLAVLAVAAGCYQQTSRLTRPLLPMTTRAELDGVTRLYDHIGAHCRQYGWTKPRVALGSVQPFLWRDLLTPFVYERQGVLLRPTVLLGDGISAVSEEVAVEAVRQSDIVMLMLNDQGTDVYPFVKCMRAYQARLLAVCRETHLEVDRTRLPWGVLVLFVRPGVGVDWASGGWITDAGVMLTSTSLSLKARPHIELRGSYVPEHLGKAPAVQAELRAPDQAPRPVRARIDVSDKEYRLVLDLVPDEVPAGGDIKIHITFDRYFVPAERPELFGSSEDTRHLVVLAPDEVTLGKAPSGTGPNGKRERRAQH
jgi:hypothetical protein